MTRRKRKRQRGFTKFVLAFICICAVLFFLHNGDVVPKISNVIPSPGKGDQFEIPVSLQERVEITDKNEADLFVSVHVNSSVTPEGNGLETHYYTPQSYEFAQIVHKEFASAIDSKDRGLFKSKFYVINHTQCPSILVETGFISNPEERKELMTNQRRQKTAEAIAKGIVKYLDKN